MCLRARVRLGLGVSSYVLVHTHACIFVMQRSIMPLLSDAVADITKTCWRRERSALDLAACALCSNIPQLRITVHVPRQESHARILAHRVRVQLSPEVPSRL